MISSVAAKFPPRLRQEALGEWGGTVMYVVPCSCSFSSLSLPLLVVLGYLLFLSFPQLSLIFSNYLVHPFPPVPFFPLIRSLFLSLFLLLSLSDSRLSFSCQNQTIVLFASPLSRPVGIYLFI